QHQFCISQRKSEFVRKMLNHCGCGLTPYRVFKNVVHKFLKVVTTADCNIHVVRPALRNLEHRKLLPKPEAQFQRPHREKVKSSGRVAQPFPVLVSACDSQTKSAEDVCNRF